MFYEMSQSLYHQQVAYPYLAADEAQVLQGLTTPDGRSFESEFESVIIRRLLESEPGEIIPIVLAGQTGSGKSKLAHDLAIAISKHSDTRKELRRQQLSLDVVTAPYVHSGIVSRRINPGLKDFRIGRGSPAHYDIISAFWKKTVSETVLSHKLDDTKTVLIVELPLLQGYPIPHIRPLEILGKDNGVGADRGLSCLDMLNHDPRTHRNLSLIFLSRQQPLLQIAQSDRGTDGKPDKSSQLNMIFTYPGGAERPFSQLPRRLQSELTKLRRNSQTPSANIALSDASVEAVKNNLAGKTYEADPYHPTPILEGDTDRDLLFAITRSLGVPDERILTPVNNAIAGDIYWYFSYLIQMNMWAMRHPQEVLGKYLHRMFANHIAKSPYRAD